MRTSIPLHTLKATMSGLCLLILTALAPAVHVGAVAAGENAYSTFCTNLSNRADAFQTRFSAKQSALDTTWQKQTVKLQSIVMNEDTVVNKVRAEVDQDRAKNQAGLLAKAKNDQEITAVQAYDSAVASAVQARRTAVDTARSTFRDGIKSLLVNRQATVSGRVGAFQIAVDNAYSTAENSCTDQTDGATVRGTLLQGLATARQNFESGRAIDTTTSDLQTLVAARNSAIQTANSTFLQSTGAARQNLKAAFGEDASSI